MAYESDIYWTRRQADLVEAIDSLVIPHRVAGDDSATVISPTDSDYSPLGSIISMARGYGALMRRSSSKYSTESASSCYSTDGGYGSIRSRSRSTHRRAYGGREALPAPPKIIINDGIFGGDTFSSPSAATSSSPYYDSQFYPSKLSHYSPVPNVDQDARTISSNASAVRDSVYSNRHSRGDSYSSNSSDEEPFAGTRLSRSPTRRILSDNSYGPTRTLSRSRQPRSNLLPQRRGAIQRRNRPANATPRWSTIEATAADPEPVQASRGLRRKYSWEA